MPASGPSQAWPVQGTIGDSHGPWPRALPKDSGLRASCRPRSRPGPGLVRRGRADTGQGSPGLPGEAHGVGRPPRSAHVHLGRASHPCARLSRLRKPGPGGLEGRPEGNERGHCLPSWPESTGRSQARKPQCLRGGAASSPPRTPHLGVGNPRPGRAGCPGGGAVVGLGALPLRASPAPGAWASRQEGVRGASGPAPWAGDQGRSPER